MYLMKSFKLPKKLSLLSSLLCVTLFSHFTLAGEQVDKVLAADDITEINVDNLRGYITLVGWDKKQVKVVGELDDKARKLVFKQKNSAINIKVHVPKNSSTYNNNRNGSKLTIYAPKQVRVDANGVSSDYKVSGFLSGTDIKTISGDITANDLSGYIELKTVSGDISAQNLSDKIELSTVSGEIQDRNSQGRLAVKAVSGDIDVLSKATEVSVEAISGNISMNLNNIDELSITTVSGNAESRLALNDRAVVKTTSVSGDIDLSFTRPVSASFRFNASAGGQLVNKISSVKADKAKYGPQSKLTFEVGNGSASVKGHTVSGRIKVSQD